MDNFKFKKIKILTVIASYGYKNIELLKKVIQRYQTMKLDIDIIVLSETQKYLGENIETIVGLPTKNKWSLPFAHKKVFADRVNQYDIFIYSEDDIGVEENSIYAFLQASVLLNENEIAGFIRYEISKDGERFIPDIHGSYHWKAESTQRRGNCIIAELTNHHSAFYILTQDQLRKAIISNGFLKEPYEGLYDLACTAATDPYTSCGFKKVICISEIEKFLIHHMSNRYAGKVGIGFSEFKSQIKTLNNICGGLHPASTLCNTESKILHGKWSKSYYEEPIEEILSFLPKSLKRVLSVGCGWGRTEKLLIDKGAEVTGLPLDSVIGASASNFPINIIYGTLEDAIKSLRGEKFDTIIMTNLLHLIKEPLDIIDDLIKFLCEGGSLLLGGPNFEFLPHLLMRCLKRSDFKNINNYRESGINGLTIRSIRKKLMCLGVNSIKVKWYNSIIPSTLEKKGNAIARNYLARDWALIARLNNN